MQFEVYLTLINVVEFLAVIRVWRLKYFIASQLTLLFLVNAPAIEAKEQCVTEKEPVNVWLILPDDSRNSFWRASTKFAEAVANDLDVQLRLITIEDNDHNRIGFESLVKATLNSKNYPAPDFIISILYGGGEFSQLTLFSQYDIPLLTINTSLDERLLQITGTPREQFRGWKAHMSPNETFAGMQLVEELHKTHSGRTMAILGGSTLSAVNKHRIAGAIMKAKQLGINIVPPIYTNWTKTNAIDAARALLRRAPTFDILWTAGPDIAAGAIEVLSEAGHQSVVGSFDWSSSNLELIRNQKLQVSFGGHFMEAGWAIILVYDYMNGLDFINETGSLIDTKLMRLHDANVEQIAPMVLEQQWQKIDFSQYAKCANTSLDKYDFRLY